MKHRKKSKIISVKPKPSPSGVSSPESEARLQEFIGHAIGGHVDAYLKNLAMTVVHLKAISEIAALQSNLLKEKTRIDQQTEALADSKVEIAQARRQLTLERKKIAEVRESLQQAEKVVKGMNNSVPAEALKIKEKLRQNGAYSADEYVAEQKPAAKETPLNSGRHRG